MDELKMSIEEMISMLDGAAGRLIVASMENTTIKEAMEMVTNVSISLGEWANEMQQTPKCIFADDGGR